MPFSASVVVSDFSDEKHTAAPPRQSSPSPSSARSLSLAVTTATFAPARWNAAKMVGARRKRGSFIITSSPVSGSNR